MFFSEVSLGQGESVYPDLKERGEGGGFYQTKIPKTIARVERFFLLREVSFSSLKNLFK